MTYLSFEVRADCAQAVDALGNVESAADRLAGRDFPFSVSPEGVDSAIREVGRVSDAVAAGSGLVSIGADTSGLDDAHGVVASLRGGVRGLSEDLSSLSGLSVGVDGAGAIRGLSDEMSGLGSVLGSTASGLSDFNSAGSTFGRTSSDFSRSGAEMRQEIEGITASTDGLTASTRDMVSAHSDGAQVMNAVRSGGTPGGSFGGSGGGSFGGSGGFDNSPGGSDGPPLFPPGGDDGGSSSGGSGGGGRRGGHGLGMPLMMAGAVGIAESLMTGAGGLMAVNETIKDNPQLALASKNAMDQLTQGIARSGQSAVGVGVPGLAALGSTLHSLGAEIGVMGAEHMGTALSGVTDLAGKATGALKNMDPAIESSMNGLFGVGGALMDGIASPKSVAGIKATSDALADAGNDKGLESLVSNASGVAGTVGRVGSDAIGTAGNILGSLPDALQSPALTGGAVAALTRNPMLGAISAGADLQAQQEESMGRGDLVTPSTVATVGGYLGGRGLGYGKLGSTGFALGADALATGTAAAIDSGHGGALGQPDSGRWWKNQLPDLPGTDWGWDNPANQSAPGLFSGGDWSDKSTPAGKDHPLSGGGGAASGTDYNMQRALMAAASGGGGGGGGAPFIGGPGGGGSWSASGPGWTGPGGDLINAASGGGGGGGMPFIGGPGGGGDWTASGPGWTSGDPGDPKLTSNAFDQGHGPASTSTAGHGADYGAFGTPGTGIGNSPGLSGVAAPTGGWPAPTPGMPIGAHPTALDPIGTVVAGPANVSALSYMGPTITTENGFAPGWGQGPQAAASLSGVPQGMAPGRSTGPTGPMSAAGLGTGAGAVGLGGPMAGLSAGAGRTAGPAAESLGALNSALSMNAGRSAQAQQSNMSLANSMSAFAQNTLNATQASQTNTAAQVGQNSMQQQSQSQNGALGQSISQVGQSANSTASNLGMMNQSMNATSQSAADLGQSATSAMAPVSAMPSQANSSVASTIGALNSAAPAMDATSSAMGAGAMSSMASGISSGAGQASDAASSAASGAASAAASASDSSSPSRVWMGLGRDMTDGGAIGINNGASSMAGAATSAIHGVTDAARGVASDSMLMVGFSYVESLMTGAEQAIKTSDFQQLGFPDIQGAKAKSALGALGLMGPAGSGAQSYQLSAQEVSFATGTAANQPAPQPIIIQPQHIYLDGQHVVTIAEQVFSRGVGNLVDTLGRQRTT